MSNSVGQLDTVIDIVTPENITFHYRVAGPFRRLPAYLIDLLIRTVMIFGMMIALVFSLGMAGLPGIGMGMTLVVAFVLEWFYGGLFEAFWNGQTPGKRLLGIRVLTIDGQPINALQAVLRNVLRVVDCQPLVLCQVGMLAATMNDRFQRLGDLACGTMVVIEQPRWFRGVPPMKEPEAVELSEQIPPEFQPSRSLAMALANYVQRRANFPPPRRLEIAQHVGGPLRERFGLPAQTNPDLLLCAVYYRTFLEGRR